MPADTAEKTEAQAPETKEAKPDLQSTIPSKIAKKRSEDTVYSRSRRQNLGGAVTTVYLQPDGRFRVEGPGGEPWGVFSKFGGRGQALDVARNGPAEEEAEEATTEEPEAEGEEATEEAQEEEGTEAEATEQEQEPVEVKS
jgi:hypothetical protein